MRIIDWLYRAKNAGCGTQEGTQARVGGNGPRTSSKSNELDDHSLTPGQAPRVGETLFADWLSPS
jgi:hypothetical protein